MEERAGLQILLFGDQLSWSQWLGEHYAQIEGVWLKLAKKNGGASTVSYAEALDEALCYGWIDGQVGRYDEQYYLQRFTPRRSRSVWSKTNTEKAEQLCQTGRMHPAGWSAIETAKANGRWEAAYAPSSTMTLPPDFQTALDAHPQAQTFFQSLNKLNRYAFYYRIQSAPNPKIRTQKIEKFITMLTEGKKFHP